MLKYAKAHLEEHRLGGVKVPCPGAKEHSCAKTFANSLLAQEHSKIHQPNSPRFPCPHAEEHNCRKCFVRRATARKHAETHNPNRPRFPCPGAEKHGCKRTFVSTHVAQEHAEEHDATRKKYPCPGAEEFGCNQTFYDKNYAEKHLKVHDSNRPQFPRPLAAEHSCHEMFLYKRSAELHAKVHDPDHLGEERVPCLLAGETGCTRGFATEAWAQLHAVKKHASYYDATGGDTEIMAHEKQYICKVPRCAATVSQYVFAYAGMRSHMCAHIKRGHLSDLERRVPTATLIAIGALSLGPDPDPSEDNNAELHDDFEEVVNSEQMIDSDELFDFLVEDQAEQITDYNTVFSHERRNRISETNNSIRGMFNTRCRLSPCSIG